MTTRIYLHGVPGSVAELRYFAPDAQNVIAPDHLAFSTTESLVATLPAGPLHLIGFSLGAFVALRLAALLGPQVERLDLISAAAPLELGDFLAAMAGGDVFRMARDQPTRFGMIVQFQAMLARIAPALLVRLLFHGARGGDEALVKDAAFKAMISASLRETFGANKPGYRAAILAYVQPWANTIHTVTAPTHIWQGLDDTWTPPAMAESLSQALLNVQSVSRLRGDSHYSTLARVLPKLVG